MAPNDLPVPDGALRVLLLGGTTEGRALAAHLAGRVHVVTSLAGRVSDPVLPEGDVRIGGFGGPAGLAAWLRDNHTDAVIDATHPFAVTITQSAATATRETGTALIRLQRPGWVAGPGDHWIRVPDLPAAATALTDLGERVFLTTGRQGLATFAGLDRHWFLVRTVNPPEAATPARMRTLIDRGPFTVDAELALMREHAIDVLVTKDSGGTAAAAKLSAAARLDLPVVMVDRPPHLPVPTVTTVEEVLTWLRQRPARDLGTRNPRMAG